MNAVGLCQLDTWPSHLTPLFLSACMHQTDKNNSITANITLKRIFKGEILLEKFRNPTTYSSCNECLGLPTMHAS